MTCVSECFEKFESHPALQVLYDCVNPNCSCPNNVTPQNYDVFFLQSSEKEALPDSTALVEAEKKSEDKKEESDH